MLRKIDLIYQNLQCRNKKNPLNEWIFFTYSYKGLYLTIVSTL